uniref:Uncharacterized protein n=1 Tax=Octopus bimaculoides TaxID=37653 RepID=A0A0L8FY24_OCTBM
MSGGQNDNLEMEERDVSSTGAQPKNKNEIMNNTEGEEEKNAIESIPSMCTEDSTQENSGVAPSNNGYESVRRSEEDVNIEENVPLMSGEATDQQATPESSRRTPDADKESAITPKTGEESRERYPKQEENSLRNGVHGDRVVMPGTTPPSAPETADQNEIPGADENQTNRTVKKGRPCIAACRKDHQCMILVFLIVMLGILAIANLVRIEVINLIYSLFLFSSCLFHNIHK